MTDESFGEFVRKSYEQAIEAAGTLFVYEQLLGNAKREVARTSRHLQDYSLIVDGALETVRYVKETYPEYRLMKIMSERLEIDANQLKIALMKSGNYNAGG